MVFGKSLIAEVDPPGCDFCILATNQRELSALLKRVEDVCKLEDAQYPLFSARIPFNHEDSGTNDLVGLIMSTDEVGRVAAAIATSLLLRTVTPRWLLLTGIAGGIPGNGVTLGDVIVATQIIDYEYVRLAESPERRLRFYKAGSGLLKASRHVGGDWIKGFIRPGDSIPKVHFGPILSGDKVIASTEIATDLLKIDASALGVEMEGGGVAAAVGRAGPEIDLLMVRGVADLANSNKRADAEIWTEYACDAAAALTLDILRMAQRGDVHEV